MPPGGGSVGGGIGNVPSGATLVRVHVPAGAVTQISRTSPNLPGSNGAAGFPWGPTPPPTPTPLPLPPAQGGMPGGAIAQALAISVSGPSSVSQTMGLTPASTGCAPVNGGGLVCQLAMSLGTGNYTAAITAYGQASAAPGTQIGSPQTVAFTVVAGGNNIVNLSLGGVPAALDIAPGSQMSGETAQGTIDLYGSGKHPLVVQMVDANQNIIVAGMAPSYVVTQAAGPLSLTLLQPTSAGSNVFTVTPSATSYAGTAMVHASAQFAASASNPCMQPGAVCSGSQTVDVRQILAVANSSANTVTLYAGAQNVPLVTIQNGITDPQALVFDAAGDLFVANQPGSISEYAAPYTGLPNTIGVGINHPQALALDARGDLFVANGNGSNTVTEYSAPYTGAPNATISTGIDDPVSLGLDQNANLFVANQAANTVTQYAPPYNDAPTTISNGLNGPNSVALDARGNLFVSNLNSTPNSVVQFSPPYTSSSGPVAWITNGVNEQGAIGLGPTSNLFVPNQGANTVTEYSQPYGTPTVISGGQNQPIALAVDALGNLYVANYGGNTVTLYPSPYGAAAWLTIANGIANPQALALSPATATGLVP